MMLNLPGATPARDRQMFKELFFNPDFQPDLLKIYPCAVLKTAKLYHLWRAGQYRPYTEKQLVNLLLKIKQTIPPYVRIQRIIRDIPAGDIVAGNKTSNLRQLINNSGKKQCRCIRCREIKSACLPNDKIKLFRQNYLASGGQEIFLSFESPDRKKLYALLRLRIPAQTRSVIPARHQVRGKFQQKSEIYSSLSVKGGGEGFSLKPGSRIKCGMTRDTNNNILPVLEDAALIRELHTYGQLISLSATDYGLQTTAVQHKGLGQRLMQEIERIVKTETPCKKIAVISGVGAREYYKKLGYKLKEEYMIKNL